MNANSESGGTRSRYHSEWGAIVGFRYADSLPTYPDKKI